MGMPNWVRKYYDSDKGCVGLRIGRLLKVFWEFHHLIQNGIQISSKNLQEIHVRLAILLMKRSAVGNLAGQLRVVAVR